MQWISLAFYLLLFRQAVPNPPVPTLISIEPATIVNGTTVAVTFHGTGFVAQQSGPEVSSAGGPYIPFSSAGATTWTDENTMTVLWTVRAPVGTYYVEIRTGGFAARSNLLPITVVSSAIPGSPAYRVTTVAGGPGGPGFVDGQGNATRFMGPTGNVWSDGEFLYIPDLTAIRKLDLANGTVTTVAGTPFLANYFDAQGTDARFNFPSAVWGDGQNLYVADQGNSSVRKIVLSSGDVTTVGTRGMVLNIGNDLRGAGGFLYYTVARSIYKLDPESGTSTLLLSLPPIGPPPPPYYSDLRMPLWVDQHYLYFSDNGSMNPQFQTSVIRRIDLDTGDIEFVAGSDSQTGYVDGPGAAARFKHPSALWSNGTALFVADADNQMIRRIDLATNEVSTLTGQPQSLNFTDSPFVIDGSATTSRFYRPAGLWGDDTYLYVPDLYVIRRITIATGDVTTVAGSSWQNGRNDGIGDAARFAWAQASTVQGKTLYVVDSLQGAIRQMDLSSGEVRTLGNIPVAMFQPIWADPASLYTINPKTGLIQRFDLSTGQLSTITSLPDLGTSTFLYRGIWGDGTNLYIGGNKQIFKVSLATNAVSVLAGAPLTGAIDDFIPKDGIGTAAHFVTPTGLWGDGNALYVADTRMVRKVDLTTAEVTTIAGGALSSGLSDGVGTDALFTDLSSIWGDSQFLYVTEPEFDRIRRISRVTGEVNTIAGQFAEPGTEDGEGAAAHFSDPISIAGDGTNLYVSDEDVIRKLSPIPPGSSSQSFTLTSNGSTSMATSGTSTSVTAGYAAIQQGASTGTLSGFARLEYRQNGVLISEASVGATHLIQTGRIFTPIEADVRTGVAIANPNNDVVSLSFFFTDANGIDFGAGTTTIPADGQIARFLDETPFSAASTGTTSATFTFTASAPVGVVALRGLVNQRSEFLMTTLPVTDLSGVNSTSPPIASAGVSFPQFASGGGWTSDIGLVNPTNAVLKGQISFLLDDGTVDSTMPYTIAPRSAFTLNIGSNDPPVRTGQVRVLPDPGSSAPDGILVYRYLQNGIIVSETGVPAMPAAAGFRTYIDASAGVRTGIALANSGNSSITVTLSLSDLAGQAFGTTATVNLPANGHRAFFLDELPEFASLPAGFRGVLRVVASSSLSIISLRGEYNQRGDFLMSTVPVIDDQSAALTSPQIFPQVVDGGGYTTEFVLFSTSSANASGTVELHQQSGSPLVVGWQ